MTVGRFDPVGGGAVRHVIFDLDGTLVDSRADLAAAVNHTRTSLGSPPLPPAELYPLVGRGARVLVEQAVGPDRSEAVEEGVAIFLAYYRDHLLDTTRPYPGIPETLPALRAAGCALSVLTNKPDDLSLTVLDGLGLIEHLVDVVGGDRLGYKKPNPAGVHFLGESSGVPLRETLLVGDSPIDVETGRNAGVRTCGVSWGLVPEALGEAAPDILIHRPEELLSICGTSR